MLIGRVSTKVNVRSPYLRCEMIQRTGSFFEVACDRCSIGYERIDTYDFKKAVHEIQMRGWRVFLSASKRWTHLCPDCKHKR